jgi:NAD(P)H-flavin reductase
MLYVFGVGEIPISISGNPLQTDRLIHTTRVVGSVTEALFRQRKGETIGVRGPFGSSWPVAKMKGKDVVILAGGIGLAPLRPVIYQLLANRKNFGRVALLYGARTPEDLLFGRELAQWKKSNEIDVFVTVDRAAGNWGGSVGVVTQLIKKAAFNPGNSISVMCGPEIMMRFCWLELLKLGCPEESIYLSMERNMKCAIGFCGHCQYGSEFICKDGPVFPFPRIRRWFEHEGF